ncbi:hypothetical protein [Aestuariivirga sp.]|uniref:hypothetical protein n=1 Tax=Aestuariivirga sp. TaxID=2650926 RepID=UPI0039E6FCE5
MPTDLLTLPAAIQLALASGYAAYCLAYIGIRKHHKNIDTTFITLVFSLIATLVYAIFPENVHAIWSIGITFLVTILCGALWRKWGRSALQSVLRSCNVSWANDDPTSLDTITSSTKFNFTQVSVEMKNGTWLQCNEAEKFVTSPHGPFTIGTNGDIAMYLTHEQSPGMDDTEAIDVRSPDWGDCITYVPADQIQRIAFRLKARR